MQLKELVWGLPLTLCRKAVCTTHTQTALPGSQEHFKSYEGNRELGLSAWVDALVLLITESPRSSKGQKVKFPANWTEEIGTNLLACWQHLVPVLHLKGS